MFNILLTLQIILVTLMVFAILIQKNDGNGLAGLSGSGSGIISNRASGNFLSKLTMFLAILFMANSLALAKLTTKDSNKAKALLESLTAKSEPKELEAPVAD